MTGACDELLGRVERLEARLERVESVQSIERLAQRYALAADARDLESLLLLFHLGDVLGRERSSGGRADRLPDLMRTRPTTRRAAACATQRS